MHATYGVQTKKKALHGVFIAVPWPQFHSIAILAARDLAGRPHD